MPTIAPDDFKEVMRRWAAGVTVVTTCFAGAVHGCTANSFTSVSLTPPLVAISLAKATQTFQMIKQSKVFAVSILGEDQQAISIKFAGHTPDARDRFQSERFHGESTGSPVLDDAIAFADCRLVSEHDVGMNVILIGMVEVGRVQHLKPPLIYSDRQYWKLTR